jgi:AcrR family transcriptional regulator
VTKSVTPKIEKTRRLILEAVGLLLEEQGDLGFAFDAIAKRADVSRRTVLNHFPDKNTLMKEFWLYANEKLELHQWPKDFDDLTKLPPATFMAFDGIEGIVRAIQSSESGRKMRLLVNEKRRDAYEAALSDQTLDPQSARRTAAIVQALSSPHVWLALKDYWDMDGQEAGEAVAWAIQKLLATQK